MKSLKYRCTECSHIFELTVARPRKLKFPKKATHLEVGSVCEDCWQSNEPRRFEEEPTLTKCDLCGTTIHGLEACTNSVTEGTYCSVECSDSSMRKEYEKRMVELKHLEKVSEPTGTTPDPITPSHYHHGGLDVFTIMEKNMPHQLEGFFLGNVLKYVMRYEYKNGVEDLKKAQKYLDKLIELKDNK